MLISEEYREQNRKLHETNECYGVSGRKIANIIKDVIEAGGYQSILDFGAGKGTLAAALAEDGYHIAEYDPAIPGKDRDPEPAELVICSDVLEHVEPDCLDAVLNELKRLTKRKLVVLIDTELAGKVLPDGRNAHLIVETPAWWGAKISKLFDVLDWRFGGRKIYAELAPKLPGTWPKQRRTQPNGWDAQTAFARDTINRYADAFSRIDSVNMWEGVGDVVADMQVAVWIVEHMPDIAAAIHNIACLSSKAAVFVIDLTSGRDVRYWHQMIDQRFRIYAENVEGDCLTIVGGPKLAMHGIKSVGVVDAETRWEQAKEAMKRYKARVPVAPAHDRLAILACYGPSLNKTIEDLKLEARSSGADVISVSGAHDFLLRHGVEPTFHVECDPRAHKADNIARFHPGTRYFLASCVHEALFDKLGHDADIALWHIAAAQHSIELIDELGEDPRTVITGGGSVGLRSISLLYAMGYRHFSIHGMDCSFASDGMEQHAGKHAGERQNVCTFTCGGRVFSTSHILKTYATDFIEMIQRVNDLDICLHGDGLLQAMVEGLPQ